jgi:DNA-binding FadR family transcriptional regulator
MKIGYKSGIMASENEQRALNHLRRLMTMGQYPQGSRLPTERVLSYELGMARGPIRLALSTLEAEGTITRNIGSGTFVGRPAALRQPEETTTSITSGSPGDLLETRLTIEPRVAAMAAVRASKEDIDYLNLCVARSENAADWATWARWDSTFHRTIALASGNSILANMIDMMNKARRGQNRQNTRQQAIRSDWRPILVNQHRAIVRTISAHDPAGAARAMRDHLRGVEERLFGDAEDLAEFIERL